jgi:hypothetical protein
MPFLAIKEGTEIKFRRGVSQVPAPRLTESVATTTCHLVAVFWTAGLRLLEASQWQLLFGITSRKIRKHSKSHCTTGPEISPEIALEMPH